MVKFGAVVGGDVVSFFDYYYFNLDSLLFPSLLDVVCTK